MANQNPKHRHTSDPTCCDRAFKPIDPTTPAAKSKIISPASQDWGVACTITTTGEPTEETLVELLSTISTAIRAAGLGLGGIYVYKRRRGYRKAVVESSDQQEIINNKRPA